MTPLRDPVKNIVYNATPEDIDRVWVNGRLVLEDGRVQGVDERKIFARCRREANGCAEDGAIRLGGAGRGRAVAADLSRVVAGRR
jgi:cytosine/adenosine deaminase-related metal-dependent hydrolase